ncbi:amidase signature domain-containing protein [Podospora australis]|uniref:Amidase signature domain-containing protein n=1 Tax=Podospora australis TaxID=1536484 RepID=A0AAN7AJG4_9PEZI|nr:amidase signature domain-containing protein [Podospora australis]
MCDNKAGISDSWEEIVDRKLSADNAKIENYFQLDEDVISRAKSRKKITGKCIEDILEDLAGREAVVITSLDANHLVKLMAEGQLTATEVVTAFCARAAIAHQLSGLLLEIGFDAALARAKELDEYYQKHGTTVGPLHGLPVTLKDQFHIRDLETTMGYVGWIGTFEGSKHTGKEKNVESQLVQELWKLGAVPIGKAPETNNNILGYTLNPHNQLLSTGGSSGGEAAMQALRGSAFGIGTDIGGSVSMPAALQSIYSLKPSSGRISFKDAADQGRGQTAIPTVAGIMGPSVATLRLVFQSLLSTKPWLSDPYTLPIPWTGTSKNEISNPVFALMPHDGIVSPHPPISRALKIVEAALRNIGINCLPWNPPKPSMPVSELHGKIVRGNACPEPFKAIQLSNEPVVPEMEGLYPDRTLREPISVDTHESLVAQMKDFRNRYNDYWMSSARHTGTSRPVDAVIAPVTPYAGFQPGEFKHGAEYTTFLNLLDLPNVVIPVAFASKNIDEVPTGYKPLSEQDAENMKLYDPEVCHGAPAAIQIFGRRLDEERLLLLAEIVDSAVRNYEKTLEMQAPEPQMHKL